MDVNIYSLTQIILILITLLYKIHLDSQQKATIKEELFSIEVSIAAESTFLRESAFKLPESTVRPEIHSVSQDLSIN